MNRFQATVEHLPLTDDRCGWWETLPTPSLSAPMRGAHTFDCAIVGAGYTGLAAARQLATRRPDWRIAVLDALEVGQGSAGRNSGFIVNVGHYQPALGPDGNAKLIRLARMGIDALRDVVEGFEIGCDWRAGRRLHVAVNARGRKALETFRAGLDAVDEPYTRLDAAETAAIVGTSYYSEALLLEGGACVQPAALVRGLAGSLPGNVTLFERSPVERIDPGPPYTLHAAHGQARATHLMLATNGYSGWFGVAKGRVVPLLTFASLTRPLTLEESDSLGGESDWGAVPEERMGSTVRRTMDGRLLIRNGVRYVKHPRTDIEGLEAVAADHRRSFERRFPDLAHVPFAHTWGGVLGMTLNNGLAFKSIGENAFVAAGHNGVGIALGTVAGVLMADTVAGYPPEGALREALAAIPAPAWMPPDPLLAPGLWLYTTLLQTLAGSER